MNNRTLQNFSLIAAIVSCLIQTGAQLFALLVIVRTLIAAPPRSFAMLGGEYGYDSSFFWQTVPNITLALIVVAIIANWKTTRRNLLLASLAIFLIGGALYALVVGPEFAKLTAIGYSDAVDVSLQGRAATFFMYDCALWLIALTVGITQLVALARPITNR